MVANEYRNWVSALKKRYRATQIKAAVAVNSAMLEFYWALGADISRMYPGKKRNLNFFENLSNDLCLGIENPKGLSVANIRYAFRFYELYSRLSQVAENNAYLQQAVDDNNAAGYLQQVVEDKTTGEHSPHGNNKYLPEIVKVPWGHHTVILGKCKGDRDKALFYVRETVKNGWSPNTSRRLDFSSARRRTTRWSSGHLSCRSSPSACSSTASMKSFRRRSRATCRALPR